MKQHLMVSDFDQTLSFDDSGGVLCDILGIDGFQERVSGLSRLNLVQEGAELTYLLRHDPEFRRVRREHLVEAGRRVHLKRNVAALVRFLEHGTDDLRFEFYVVSAAPEDVVFAALDGILSPDRIIATRLDYDRDSGEVASVTRVAAGYGKVAAVEELRMAHRVPRDRVVYVGDGSSDLHVMLHVNRGDGITIAASEARHIAEVARRTVISDDALSVLVPVLEEIGDYPAGRIRTLFEEQGFLIQEWDKVRTDRVTIRASGEPPA
jgi:2-hydroxy-3-keto-5-methylthiopentenyl-1-phosphate phosphatase